MLELVWVPKLFVPKGLKGNSGRKEVKIKWKSVENAPLLTSMRQMILEISHSKVSNLSKMHVAILQIFSLNFT